jgi:hypothetical protein
MRFRPSYLSEYRTNIPNAPTIHPVPLSPKGERGGIRFSEIVRDLENKEPLNAGIPNAYNDLEDLITAN